MNRRAKKANILFVRCTGKSVLCCRLAVALFLAVLLLGCQTAPRDLRHESLRLPRFKNYYGADESVAHFVLTPDPWRRTKSAFEKTASLTVTIDGAAAGGHANWVSLAPRPYQFVSQVKVPPTSPEAAELYSDPISVSFVPKPKHIYAFVVYATDKKVQAGFLPLGTLGGGARGLSVAEVRAIAWPGGTLGIALAEEISEWAVRIASRWNEQARKSERNARIMVAVKVDDFTLTLSRPLLGDDAQRLVDRARDVCDCARGNAVALREGLLSTGHRLSVALRCDAAKRQPWEAPVRIGELEIPPTAVSNILRGEPTALAQLYRWLQKQKIKPALPADRIDELAAEIGKVLDGRSRLRAVRP